MNMKSLILVVKIQILLAEITNSLINLMNVQTTVNLLDSSSKREDVYIDNSEAVSKAQIFSNYN